MQDVVRRDWFSCACCKNQIVRGSSLRPLFPADEHLQPICRERQLPSAGRGFRGVKNSVVNCLFHIEAATLDVEILPAQGEQLSPPHSSQKGQADKCAGQWLKFRKQLPCLYHCQNPFRPERRQSWKVNTTCRICPDVTPFHSLFQHSAEDVMNVVNRVRCITEPMKRLL